MRNKVNGLTLIELIVTVSLISIATALSLPPLQHFIAKQQLSSDLLAIKGVIETARNSAIVNNSTLRICGSIAKYEADEEKTVQCNRNWKRVTVLKDFETEFEEVVNQITLSDNFSKVQWSAFQYKTYLDITANGFTDHQNGTLYLCHKHYDDLHRAIVVSKTARVHIEHQSKALYEKCAP